MSVTTALSASVLAGIVTFAPMVGDAPQIETPPDTDAKTVQAVVDKTTKLDLDAEEVNVIGVEWKGENPKPEIRYKENGEWSDWQALEEDDDGADEGTPDAERAAKLQAEQVTNSAVVPVLNSDEVQVRSADQNADPEEYEVTAVSTEVTEEDEEIAEKAPADVTNLDTIIGKEDTAQNTAVTSETPGSDPVIASAVNATAAQGVANAVTPAFATDTQAQTPTAEALAWNPELKVNVVTRKEWGANENKVKCTSSKTAANKGVIVHHTAGSNSYSRAQAPGIIRGYLNFHTNSRGWCDLGYNFLVDRFGTIYEGRAGSLNEAVVGAHSSGFNTGTLGISVVGTYGSSAPSSAAQNSVARITAWGANKWGYNPTGKMTLTSAGGGTSKYAKGRTVTLNVVGGHRDTSYTDCPGNAFYNRLGSIRTNAKNMQSKVGGQMPYELKGAIKTYFNEKGGVSTFGLPTGPERPLSNPSGAYQQFQKGSIHWSKSTGAHFTKKGSAIQNKWKDTKYEKGYLGFPSSDETNFKYRSGAVYQNFQGGMVAWSSQTKAHPMKGAMLSAWKSDGWERSTAGLPRSGELPIKGGVYQKFEKGSYHWSSKTGAHFSKYGSPITNKWGAQKYENGPLGYPTSNEYQSGGKTWQNYQGGKISWTSREGAKVHYN